MIPGAMFANYEPMNITLINGSPGPEEDELDRYTASLGAALAETGHTVSSFALREMDIRYCNGCWTCWWATPGICVHRDDMPDIYRSVMKSDLVIFASPVIMGFVSALLKRANERFIPLIHPYITLSQDECHHRGRYERYPDLALLLRKGPDTDAEDIKIISDIYRREALNFRGSFRFTALTDQPVQEVCREIAAL